MMLNHFRLLVHTRTQLIEHYVMVLNNKDLPQKLVKNHVLNLNILLYKMVMEDKDGVVVIMI